MYEEKAEPNSCHVFIKHVKYKAVQQMPCENNASHLSIHKMKTLIFVLYCKASGTNGWVSALPSNGITAMGN